MKLSESLLKEIIKEELRKLLFEYEEIIVRRGEKLFVVNDEGDARPYRGFGYEYLKDGESAPYEGGGGSGFGGRGSYDPYSGGYYNPNSGRFTKGRKRYY